MNRRISHGQAIRSTFGRSRVTHFIWLLPFTTRGHSSAKCNHGYTTIGTVRGENEPAKLTVRARGHNARRMGAPDLPDAARTVRPAHRGVAGAQTPRRGSARRRAG